MLYRYSALSVDVVCPLLQDMVSLLNEHTSPTSLDRVPVLSSGDPPCPTQWDFGPSPPAQGTGSLFSQQGAPCV
jgi:hypothetical protein